MSKSIDKEFWKGKRVFLTGHTGFKGSWLSLWLQLLGAEVSGLSLNPPTSPSLFKEASIDIGMNSVIGDIRNYPTVLATMSESRPEIIIHMAAQPLVRYSYQAPVDTYLTNVIGTLHILEAARYVGTVRAIINVTSDKCYENSGKVQRFHENDPMGGFDPYSSSKGCSELITTAYRRSFFENSRVSLASARAGNVIGGGDWAADRLIPDIFRALEQNLPVLIRNPNSVRPWQHVLEPLSGYIKLAESLYKEGAYFAEGWNFGPQDSDAKPVKWIVENLVRIWGQGASWELDNRDHFHEAHYLNLDISKAKVKLGWSPRWSLENSLEYIVEWHNAWLSGSNMRNKCIDQILFYQNSS